jgi:hypothetical protein
MNKNTRVLTFAATTVLVLLLACNSNQPKKEEQETAPTTAATPQLDPQMQDLLKHFKNDGRFPYVVDSAYMSKAEKFDSLNGPQVKMLIKKWFNDSLISDENHDLIMQDFYTIDSLKAKHAYTQWCQKLDIGMTKFAKVYALHRLKMNDSTNLLVWALETASYEADPNSARTSVYFTIWNGKEMGQTFILGESISFADPPQGSEVQYYGKLTADGKLVIDQSQLTEDFDSATGQLLTQKTVFQITGNNIKRTANIAGKNTTVKLSD